MENTKKMMNIDWLSDCHATSCVKNLIREINQLELFPCSVEEATHAAILTDLFFEPHIYLAQMDYSNFKKHDIFYEGTNKKIIQGFSKHPMKVQYDNYGGYLSWLTYYLDQICMSIDHDKFYCIRSSDISRAEMLIDQNLLQSLLNIRQNHWGFKIINTQYSVYKTPEGVFYMSNNYDLNPMFVNTKSSIWRVHNYIDFSYKRSSNNTDKDYPLYSYMLDKGKTLMDISDDLKIYVRPKYSPKFKSFKQSYFRVRHRKSKNIRYYKNKTKTLGGSGRKMTKSLPSQSEEIIPDFHEEFILPTYYSWHSTCKLYLKDCGSNGADCLLRTINDFMLENGKVFYSTHAIYKMLGKKPEEYLEDTDLIKLMYLYKLKVYLVRNDGKNDIIVKYATGFPDTIYIYNKFPYHYLRITGFSTGTDILNLDNFELMLINYNKTVKMSETEVIYNLDDKPVNVLPDPKTINIILKKQNVTMKIENINIEETDLLPKPKPCNRDYEEVKITEVDEVPGLESLNCLTEMNNTGDNLLLLFKVLFDMNYCTCGCCDTLTSFVSLNQITLYLIMDKTVYKFEADESTCFICLLLTDKLYFCYTLSENIQDDIDNPEEVSEKLAIPPKGCTLEIFYSYLLDVATMQITTITEALEIFKFVHLQLLDFIVELDIHSKILPEYYLKAYNKLRHNVFSFLFLRGIGEDVKQLETDADLSKWIKSDKTPDFIIERKDIIYLLEFTVGNKYETIDLIKGGGNFDIKYSGEAERMEKELGKKTKVLIIPAVLDQINLDELLKIADEITPDINRTLNFIKDFFHFANYKKHLIQRSYIKSQTVNRKVPNFYLKEMFDRPQGQTTYLFTPEFVNNFYKSFDKLKKFVLRLNDEPTSRFYFEYDSSRQRFSIRTTYKKRYLPYFQILDILENHLYQKFLSNMLVVKAGKIKDLSEIRGNVPLTLSRLLSVEKLESWSETNIINSLYFKTSSSYTDNYGTPNQFQTTDLLDFSNQQDKVAFPPDYLDQLKNIDLQPLLNSKTDSLLANSEIDSVQIHEAIDIFKEAMRQKNSAIDVCYPKPTFMMPFVTMPLEFSSEIDFSMLQLYLNSGIGDYTKQVVEKVISKNYVTIGYNMSEVSVELRQAREKYNGANEVYFKKLMSSKVGIKKYKLLTVAERMFVDKEKKTLDETHRKYQEVWGKTKKRGWKNMIKIKCDKRSLSYKDFQIEMSHFNHKGSLYAGIGEMTDQDYNGFNDYIKQLISRLKDNTFSYCIYKPLYESVRSPGNPLLTDLKNKHTESWDTFYNKFFKGTLLEQLCQVTSKLSTFLLNESVKSYGRDYVKVDNLGFDSFLVMVKGGSKIYKFQKCRLFRLFYYIEPSDVLFTSFLKNPHFEVIKTRKKYLVVTPWQQIHQDILYDWMSLPQRTFMNLYSAYTRSDVLQKSEPTDLLYLPFLLSCHNRRKTEQFMHNSRYLIVNPLGIYSNIKGIIETFADFNYTYLDAWLRKRLELKYEKFACMVLQLQNFRGNIEHMLVDNDVKDIWLDSPIFSAEQLTTFIYITYMMTKSPVNSSVEQASNLWSVLDDAKTYKTLHSDVSGLNDESQRFDVLKFDPNVYKDDFKYDPKFCQFLGFYLSNYLKNEVHPLELSNYWTNLKHQDIDHIANSNGLRGFNQMNFFNNKGYQVVYDYIDTLFTDETILDKIEDYLKSDIYTSQELIKNDKILLGNEVDTYKTLVFHIVHKIQRGGGREIFCMDLNTKMQQNPIEAFLKYLCKSIPNEFISVASNKRHKVLHHDFYEKNPIGYANYIYRWVLDCRRWAPHSVFQKYCHFIHGMANFLPTDFYNYFMDFSDKMFKKIFVTREHVLSKIRNNERFKQYENLLTRSDLAADAFSLTIPFSFVMGIFNYLSTIMHASNQLVNSEIIRSVCIKNNYGMVILDPKCHSDDSVVSSYHEKKESIRPAVLLYDWFLKGANHMLSVKKSQINQNVYLEFLSILYLFDRFLPVLPKFSSSIPFKPSDRGYSSDMSFAITQSIEMLSQGGTFDESFLIEKLTESYIKNIYNYRLHVNAPFNFLGSIDCHPIEFLYCGGLASIYSYYKYDKSSLVKVLHLLKKLKLIDLETAETSLRWDMSARLSSDQKGIIGKHTKTLDYLNEVIPWTLSNCRFGNGMLNILWYCGKLNDRSFYSSLVNEPVARKFSRIFGSMSYRTIINKEGIHYETEKLLVMLAESNIIENEDLSLEEDEFSNWFNYLEFMCKDLDYLYEALEGANIKEIIPSNLKDKPVTFSQGTSMLGRVKISPQAFTSYLKEPQGFKLLNIHGNPIRDVTKIKNYMFQLGFDVDKFSPDQVCSAAQRVLKQDTKTYQLICPVKGEKRVINNFVDVIYLLKVNSIKNMQVEIVAKKAQLLDWERKIVVGRVPHIVLDYLNLLNIMRLLKLYKIESFDIYKLDPVDYKTVIEKQLPEEWKPICFSQDLTLPLSLQYYWIYWEKEQTKVGNLWYGNGVCLVNIPELEMKLQVLSGNIVCISLYTLQTGLLSKTSSWFLACLFNILDLRTELVSSDVGLPNHLYLGYNEHDQIYGIGYAKQFDFIYLEVEHSETSLFPIEFNQKLKYKTAGRYVEYQQDYMSSLKKFKIEHFIHFAESPMLDFNKFLSSEKIGNLMLNKDDKVSNFIYNLSKEMGNTLTVNRNLLLTNISSSLIFRIFRNYSQFQNVAKNINTDEPFLNAILEWKHIHPEFGFPNENELARILKDKSMPPLPQKVFNLMVKLGYSDMSSEEFEEILVKTIVLPREEREKYLISIIPSLSIDQISQTLVVMERKTYIYDSCVMLNGRVLEILQPLLTVISENLQNQDIFSSSLNIYKEQLSLKFGKPFTNKNIFDLYSTRAIMDGFNLTMKCSTDNLYVQFILKVIDEFVDSGLLSLLNLTTQNQTYLSTIDFHVEKSIFMNWVVDLFDCLFLETTPKEMRMRGNKTLDVREIYGEGGIFAPEMGKFRGSALRLNQYHFRKNEDNVVIEFSQKTDKKFKQHRVSTNAKPKTLLFNIEESQPGVTLTDFRKLTEEWQEEFNEAYFYDEEIYEDLEFEDDFEDVPKYLYTRVNTLNFLNVTKVRGGGQNVFISGTDFDKKCLRVTGDKPVYKKLFKKIPNTTNIYKFLDDLSKVIYYVGIENFKGKIQGYEELSFEEMMSTYKPFYMSREEVLIEGQKIRKPDLYLDPKYLPLKELINHYFQTIKSDVTKTKVEDMERTLLSLDERMQPEDSTLKDIEKFKNVVAKHAKTYKKALKVASKGVKPENIAEVMENAVLDENVIQKMLIEYEKFVNLDNFKGDKFEKIKDLKQIKKFYNYHNVAEVLTDPNFMAEFETLFPGMFPHIIKNELRMTKSQINDRIFLAQQKIKLVPNVVKVRFKALLYICKLVLQSVVITESARTDPISAQFSLMIDSLFEVDLLIEEDVSETYGLEATDPINIPLNIDFLNLTE